MIFEKAGRENTAATVELVKKTAAERGIKHIVVASNTGETAALFKGMDINVVCIGQVSGFTEKGVNVMTKEMKEDLKANGVNVYHTSHALSGVERGISNKAKGMYPAEIISHTLRMLSQGVKVCVEIAIMALDGDMIPYGEEIIAVGGTGRGADTAVIMTPSHANSVFDNRIHEILCMPR